MLFSITVSSMVSVGTASIYYIIDMFLDTISVVLVCSEVSSLVILNNSNISSSITFQF